MRRSLTTIRKQGSLPACYDEADWDQLCEETDRLMQTGLFPGRYEAFQEAVRGTPH